MFWKSLKLLTAVIFLSSLVQFGTTNAQEEEELYEMEEVVVTATRTERLLKDVPIRTEIISAEDIKLSGATNLYNILDKELMGVWVETSCTNCNFSSIRMQGLESGYTLLLFDGMPIFSALAGVYGLRQIMSENIERIEVIKGSSSAVYGSSAIGGVINIITKEPTKDKPLFVMEGRYGDYNTYDFSATASMREGNIAGIISLGKGENDYVDENGDKYTDKIEQDVWNLSGKAHFYFMDDMHRLTALFRAIHEFRRGGYIPTIDDALDPDSEHITTDRYEYGAGYRGIYNLGNSLNVNFLASRHEREATNGARPFDSKEDIYIIDAIYTHPLFDERHILTGGVNYKDESLDQVINREKSPDQNAKTWGIFIQDEIALLENLELVAGCRYDDSDTTLVSDSAVSPRLGAKWDATENLTFRGSVGKGFRVPFLFAEDLHLCSAAPVIYIDPGMEPETAWNFSLGGEYRHERFIADLNLFRTNLKDKITMLFEEEGIPAGYDAMYTNAGDAYTQGVEANGRIRILEPLHLKLGVTYTDAKFDDPLNPAFSESDHIMRVPEWTGKVGLEYYQQEWDLLVNFGGRITGKMYIEKELIVGEDETEYHIDTTPTFSVWDLRVDKGFWNGAFTVFAGVDNIFDYVQDPIYNAEQEDTAAYIYAPLTGRFVYAGAKIKL